MLKWWLPLPRPWELRSLELPPRRPIPSARLSDCWVPEFLRGVHQDVLWTCQSVACPPGTFQKIRCAEAQGAWGPQSSTPHDPEPPSSPPEVNSPEAASQQRREDGVAGPARPRGQLASRETPPDHRCEGPVPARPAGLWGRGLPKKVWPQTVGAQPSGSPGPWRSPPSPP